MASACCGRVFAALPRGGSSRHLSRYTLRHTRPLDRPWLKIRGTLINYSGVRMAWQALADEAAIQEEEALGVQIGSHDIAICRLDGQIYAIHNICTHQYARLSDGYIEDGCIECPLHQGRFEIKTGAACGAPVSGSLRVYPVKVEEGKVWVELGD